VTGATASARNAGTAKHRKMLAMLDPAVALRLAFMMDD
jgi:hypothetical protein